MNLCLVLLLSSTAYDRLLRSPVSCAHLRVTLDDMSKNPAAGMGKKASTTHTLYRIVSTSHL